MDDVNTANAGEFLRNHHPFDSLSGEAMDDCSSQSAC
jgi:hypothetical protein